MGENPLIFAWVVSNQLISLASRESAEDRRAVTVLWTIVSNQLISLASRELLIQILL